MKKLKTFIIFFLRIAHILPCKYLLLIILFLDSYTFEPIIVADFLPNKETLVESLISHYRKITNFAILEKKEKDKWLIFKLLPVLGFDFIKSNPVFYINSKNFTNQFSKNSEGLSKRHAVKIDFLETISELIKLYDDLIDEIEVYNEHIKIHVIQCEIKKIREGQYSKYAITPTEYYSFLETFAEKEYELSKHLLRLKHLKNNLIAFSNLKSHDYDSRV